MKGTLPKSHDKNNDISWCKFIPYNTGAGLLPLGFLSWPKDAKGCCQGLKSGSRADEKK